MIVMMLLAAVLVIGIAVGAVLLTRAAAKKQEGPPPDKLAGKRAEWEGLASQYDAAKGYDERLSGSTAYELCRELLKEAKEGRGALEDASGTSLYQEVRLPDHNAFLSFKAGPWLKENMDLEDLQAIVGLADQVDGLGIELEQLADQACVAAHDSSDEIEKAKCREMLEEAFRLLSPSLRLAYTCPPEPDKHFKNEVAIARDALAGLAGMSARPGDGPRPNSPERRRALAADGFRCRRCGRSPLSGGLVRPVYDAHEGRHVALCENCAPKNRQ